MSAKENRVTFLAKNKTECPVCGTEFQREELLTGRGRLIAGSLTGELRRLYEPSQKFGEVYPLIYPVIVCPDCYNAAFPQDFSRVSPKSIPSLKAGTESRQKSIAKIFPDLDFRKLRGLKEGTASYYLAMSCYDAYPREFSPAIKQGIAALRAAWLCNDLHEKYPSENYDYLADIFYSKARFFYSLAVEYEQNGKEGLADVGHLGPDLDKNYGIDGVLYLLGLLEFHYGSKEDPGKRLGNLVFAKRAVSRLFGMGKSSKQKPSALLDKARDLHSELQQEVSSLEAEDGGLEETDDAP